MRIRTAKFVMIPMWVLSHDAVRGNSTRIAVYAGLRAVAWETPDMDWRSLREIARAVMDVTGVGEEAARKHLAELQRIGALVRLDDELLVPDDEPRLGTAVGTQEPKVGYDGTQSGDPTLFTLEEREENTPVGTTGVPSGNANREHPSFGAFWAEYPRKKDRFAAIRAYNAAVKITPDWMILQGLRAEILGWKRSKRPVSKIPYPATWLNAAGWLNDPDTADRQRGASATQRAADAGEVQRSEVEEAIAAGEHERAWKILVENSVGTPVSWWARAERMPERSDTVISLTLGVPLDAVHDWRRYRAAALGGFWRELSPVVGELRP